MTAKPRIYLSSPHMGGEELKLVQDAFATNWIAPLGPHVDARGGGAHLVSGDYESGVLVAVAWVDADFDYIPLLEGEAHGLSGPASELQTMRAYSHWSSLREPGAG